MPEGPNQHKSTPRRRLRRGGFTLIEILIVVVILGILAAIVVPQFTSATQQTRINALKADLFQVRQQLQIYQQEHGAWPELTVTENDADDTPAAEGTAGVISPAPPTVPANKLNAMKNVSPPSATVGTSGWVYSQDTGQFNANDSEKSRAY